MLGSKMIRHAQSSTKAAQQRSKPKQKQQKAGKETNACCCKYPAGPTSQKFAEFAAVFFEENDCRIVENKSSRGDEETVIQSHDSTGSSSQFATLSQSVTFSASKETGY